MPKIKNILIFVAIAAVFVLIYIFFIKPSPDTAALVSSTGAPVVPNEVAATDTTATIDANTTQEFLALLLNVKSIKLDDAIFSDPAFISLHDSTIVLIPDGNEGRINPFAPIGKDVAAPTCVSPQILNTLTNTCVNPVPTCTLPQVLNTTTNTCVNPSAN